MGDREDFERLVLPLMRWLRSTRNPHTSVIVTSENAELVSGEMLVVESADRIVECVCDDIDPSDRPCLVCECSAIAQDANNSTDSPRAVGLDDGVSPSRGAIGEPSGIAEPAQDDPQASGRCEACVRAGRAGPCVECPGSGVPYGLPATHTGGETQHWARKPAQDGAERCPLCAVAPFDQCGACNGTGKEGS